MSTGYKFSLQSFPHSLPPLPQDLQGEQSALASPPIESQRGARAFVKATSSLITLNNTTSTDQILLRVTLPVTACIPALVSHWLS